MTPTFGRRLRWAVLATIALLAIVALGVGYWQTAWPAMAAGGIGLVFASSRMVGRSAAPGVQVKANARCRPALPPREPVAADPSDTEGLVAAMLEQDRYALLMRPQIAAGLPEELWSKARAALEEGMSIVPSGDVMLCGPALQSLERYADGEVAAERATRTVRVAGFFLDRYPVTNRRYWEFVVAGGYGQMSLWDEAAWGAVLDFVDRTGRPGPRFWIEGIYPEGLADHPVVGVSWYEAAAYARWLGKRLPTDAEWVKAAAWPLAQSDGTCSQRRFPWGEAFDRRRANLWSSGLGHTASVYEFAEGMSAGGAYQLVGNVWEWTSGNFRPPEQSDGPVSLPCPMKSIRGGAFDTYFESQATSQFQSGENPLLRRHNIGFRCAIGGGDLALVYPQAPPAAPPDTTETAEGEEGPQ